ncbi:peroxiredoxin [Streptomyces lichenis]|uniref:thioredoxin-dependent peroxiredoxin n=1 Tax=Streptomyces lichenis TaxID=2306967 RepID=A0ABT0I7Y8_9ACTN|nr:peroxiredoxin [Streptomyces lichenis]MCK8677433.1 peroxiredoxin family protein [Streptomyces lichenis]
MPKSPEVGSPVPDFTLSGGVLADGDFQRRDYTLSAEQGTLLVLAFYPGDDTSVCTRQLCSYSSGLEAFTDLGAQVWGISPQGVDSHESFARRHGLRMPLLADPDRTVARSFGITAPGIGLRRAVFLVDADSILRWKHVSLLGATFQSVEELSRHLAAART